MRFSCIWMFLLLPFLFLSCQPEHRVTEPFKDLSEQMDVLAIYQNTIGEDLKKGDWEGARMMTHGMDSVLQLCNHDFVRHQRLKEPFRDYYEKKMEKTIKDLLRQIRKRDSTGARGQYEYLVKRCNSCHNENEVAERAHF